MSDVVGLLDYDVIIGSGIVATLAERVAAIAAAHRVAIITDDVVGPLYAGRVVAALGPRQSATYTMAAGERHKTRDSWARITDEMLRDGCGRDTTVVALGGGVVGDLAGFVAATYMRGVPVIQLPTTLLAMVDASVGGKTGVDTPAGKNLVGAFHQPAAVLVDVAFLDTLPPAHLRNGLAEMLKHGVIADAGHWHATLAFGASVASGTPDAVSLPRLVKESVGIKAEVVRADERESGRRKVLNLGHTIGHAVELLSGYSLLHGEAVAIGMVVEARIAARVGLADPALADEIATGLASVGLPGQVPAAMDPAAILAATRTDKKARAGVVEYALPSAIGRMAQSDSGEWGIPIPDDVVEAALAGH